jgi:F0F1-type ATP synthase assembly protein I
MDGRIWPLVRWVLFAQLLLALAAALLTALIKGLLAGLAVVAGGGVAMVLGLIFALRAFAIDAGSDPQGALQAMRRGMTAKMIGAIIFFMLAAKWVPQYAAQLIIGYAAATLSYWIALIKAPLAPSGQNEEGLKS